MIILLDSFSFLFLILVDNRVFDRLEKYLEARKYVCTRIKLWYLKLMKHDKYYFVDNRAWNDCFDDNACWFISTDAKAQARTVVIQFDNFDLCPKCI